MKLNTEHVDKNSLKHFLVCFAASCFGNEGAWFAGGCAVTKEYFDYTSYGHVCHWDLFFDLLGIACGLGVNYLIKVII